MVILQILIGVISAIGAAYILEDIFEVPSRKASKAVSSLGRKGKKKTSSLDIYLREFSAKIAGIIKMNEFRRAQLVIDLRTAGLDETPEQYTADAIVKAALIGVFALPAIFYSPIIAFLILGLALLIYLSESKKVSKRIKKKRERIEYDLPRFVGHIERLVTHSRDIIYIITSGKARKLQGSARGASQTDRKRRSGSRRTFSKRRRTANKNETA